MSYEQTCALSKKTISEGEKVQLIFLAADPHTYQGGNKNFYSEPAFVYPWDNFKIIGMPIECQVSNSDIRQFVIKDENLKKLVPWMINGLSGEEDTIDEIFEKIFNGKLTAKKSGREFCITYMVISQAGFDYLSNKEKEISYFDDDFLKEKRFSDEKISFEQSIKDKSFYFNNMDNINEDLLFEDEKERLEDFLEISSEQLNEKELEKRKSDYIERLYLKRYKVSVQQQPYIIIDFGKHGKKLPHFRDLFAKGLTSNIWISEFFQKYRIPFEPTMNTLNPEHNKDLSDFYKDMSDLIKK